MDLKLDNEECTVSYMKDEQRISSSEYMVISKELVKNRNLRYIGNIMSSSWQGLNYKTRIEDAN